MSEMPINPKEIASPAGRVIPPVYTTGKAFLTNFPFGLQSSLYPRV
jgi:hypothetical protein